MLKIEKGAIENKMSIKTIVHGFNYVWHFTF